MDSKKEFSPHSHIPYGKDGSGFYSDNTIGCYNVIQEGIPLVLEAIKSSVVKTGSVFTIVDYGTADGGTSMPLIYASVKAIRGKYGDDMPIMVVYEDQPVNDFKSLFMRLQVFFTAAKGFCQATLVSMTFAWMKFLVSAKERLLLGLMPGPPSFLMDFPNVFVMACGTNFYSQCVPSNSLNLGFSATSMHWLREKPCDITGALHHTMMSDPEEKDKFCKQAEKDWELILLKRAEELVLGGSMVLIQFAVDEQGQYLGHTNGSKVSMFHQMCDLWRGLVNEGRITEEEFQRTTFVNYYRTEKEFKKPFKQADSPVSQKGLELVSVETRVVRCPYHQRWMTENGDPKAHAKWYIPTLRTWSNSTFLSGLSDSRSAEEKADIVDELFQRYESEVAKAPEDHGMDYVHAYIVVQKRR